MPSKRITHPLARVHLDRWASPTRETASRRQALASLTQIGLLELARDFEYVDDDDPDIETKIAGKLAIIAASVDGLAMLEPALSLLPDADIWFMGQSPENPAYMQVLVPRTQTDPVHDKLITILLAPVISGMAPLSGIVDRMPGDVQMTYLVLAFRASSEVVDAANRNDSLHLCYADQTE